MSIGLIKSANCRIAAQQSLLSNFHRMKVELETAKEKMEKCIEQKTQVKKEILTKIAVEEKKCML